MNKNLAPKSVVWIASYPKSGNTWVQSVIRTAGKKYGFPSRDLDVYKLKALNERPESVSGVRKAVTEEPVTVLKTHSAYARSGAVHPELGLNTVGFVYVERNPLDVLLSYINFTRLQYEKNKVNLEYQTALFKDMLGLEKLYTYEEWLTTKLEDIPTANLDHALKVFSENNLSIPALSGFAGGGWLDHCKSWRRAKTLVPSVILKYEKLLESPEQFLKLRKLFRFTEDEILEAVRDMNSRQRGLQYKKVFYNKMSAYYYKDFFSSGALEAFLSKHETDLKKLGFDDMKL